MKAPISRLRAILRDPTGPVELFLAILKILWGVWLLLPFESLPSGGQVTVTMGLLANETLWGVGLLCLGGVQFVSLALGYRRPRLVLGVAAILFWWFVAGVSWVGSPAMPGALLTAWVAVVNVWIFVRLAREVTPPRGVSE